MRTKSPTFIAAVAAAIGLGACGPVDDQGPEEQQTPADTTGAAADEVVAESAAALIVCQMRVDDPHKSTHVPGTINVVATVDCTGAVSEISLTVGLARDGLEVVRSTFANSGSASLRGNAASPCVSGTYEGAAAATVTFPPGSWPASNTLHANSSRIYIGC